MKDFITTTFPPAILDEESKVKISIYMPTHRTAPDNRQDQIRFKNLVSKLEERGDYKDQVKKLRELEANQDFWQYNLDSIAVLIDDLDNLVIYRLPRDVKEYFEVGERFYLKPLIRNYQSDHRYHALGLARDQFRLYSGNRYGFREIEIDDQDRLLTNVIGDQIEGGKINVVSQGGSVGNFHGDGGKQRGIDIDTEKFFNYVDKFVRDNYSHKEKIPLILITPTEHQSTFRNVSDNEYLLPEGVERSYESIDENDLKDVLWKVLEPIYNERTNKLVEQYNVGINKGEATKTIQGALEAILNDRVHTLVLESDKTIPGKIDVKNATFELSDDGEDILNHLAYLAIARGSEVIILPEDKMPDHLSVFSILRF